MFGQLDKYLVVFLTGLVVSYLLTPLVRKLAIRFGVVDLPNARRPHKRPTARGGGLAVVLAVHAACLMAIAFSGPKMSGTLDIHWYQNFAVASLVLLVVGIVDDVRGLNPLIKLGGQALAGMLISLSGTHFGRLFGYQVPWLLDCLLVMFWIVAIINAFNLIDGLDGLASGLAIISAVGLTGFFVLGHLPGAVFVLLGLVGACLGFLRYNFHPASIFLGDTGSMFLGFTLGVVSLQTFTKSTFVLALSMPMLVLGVPIYDEILAVWRRSMRRWLSGPPRAGVPKQNGVMQPDLDHLHHRLLKAGLSTRRVTTFLFGLNAMLVAFGLLITSFESHAAGIFLFALLVAVYVLMRQLAVTELRDTGKVILNGLRRPTHATLKALGYPVWDMVWMAGAVAVAMWMFEPPLPGFWHNWFLDLPVWVTPTFSLLAASRIYITIWTRARVLDVVMLLSMLVAGSFISLALALLIDPANASTWLLRALVVGGLSHPAILGARVIYRVVEELVTYFRNLSEVKLDGERVVLYGAGGRCQLFLKERGFHNSRSFDGRVVVGLIDDEPTLHTQWVYGYKVLGGFKDLPRLVPKHNITGIIITATLSPEVRSTLRDLSLQMGLCLSEWRFESRRLDTVVFKPSSEEHIKLAQ